MVHLKDAKPAAQGDTTGASAGVSLGKGAWDADRNCLIPPEREVTLLNLFRLSIAFDLVTSQSRSRSH